MSAEELRASKRTAAGGEGVFVTGTDTGVGKTVVSALLCRAWNARYWKPLQTGAQTGDDDTRAVADWAGLPGGRLFPPVRTYQAPASPEWAAHLEGDRVSVAQVLAQRPARGPSPLVAEGAGGVYVPINEKETMLDLMKALGLPVAVVARTTLGTVNHTLLTLHALAARDIPVWGVLLNGPKAEQNAAAIERHSGVCVRGCLPPLPEITAQELSRAARELDLKL